MSHVSFSVVVFIVSPRLIGSLSVRTIWRLWQYVRCDLVGYAGSHVRDDDRCHVCLVRPCIWYHHVKSLDQATGKGELMIPDMGVMVRRYVMPWTKDFDQAGFDATDGNRYIYIYISIYTYVYIYIYIYTYIY